MRATAHVAPAAAITERKDSHIDLVLYGVGRSGVSNGFDAIRFEHNPLPEISFDDIDLSTSFLGRRLRAPLLISSMTGGPARAAQINDNLARAAESLGIALAVGSQRVSLEGRASAGLGARLRELAPSTPILANIGGAQLAKGWGVREARRAVEAIAADGLIVHLNPLQEALQPGGDRDWRGVRDGIADLARALEVPVIVKETGCGLGGGVARDLFALGVAGVDVAGAGGTHWGLIEGARGGDHDLRVSEAFRDWGVPTARAVREARAASPNGLVIASGGVRHGVDVAKAIALGADMAGQAAGVLPAALQSAEAVVAHFEIVIAQLRIACFCTGSRDLRALRSAPFTDEFATRSKTIVL